MACAARHAGIRSISLHGRDSAEALTLTGRLEPTVADVAGSLCLLSSSQLHSAGVARVPPTKDLKTNPRRVRCQIKVHVRLPSPTPCVLAATPSWHQRELGRICKPRSNHRATGADCARTAKALSPGLRQSRPLPRQDGPRYGSSQRE